MILTIGDYKPVGETKEIRFPADAPARYIRSSINNLFRRGVIELKVTFDEPKLLPAIRDALQETIGYEIITQKQNYCVIKNVAGIYEQEFDNLLRRLFLMAISLSEESYEQLRINMFKDISTFEHQRDTIEKIMNSCCQILNTTDRSSKTVSKFTYLIVYTLEKIANEWMYILRFISKNKLKLKRETLDYYNEAAKFIRSFYENYYKKETSTIVPLTKQKEELIHRGYGLLQKASKEETVVIHHLLNIVRRSYEMTGPFLGETL